jgi:hypothetical protein
MGWPWRDKGLEQIGASFKRDYTALWLWTAVISSCQSNFTDVCVLWRFASFMLWSLCAVALALTALQIECQTALADES